MKKAEKEASNPTDILAEEIGKEAGALSGLPRRIERIQKAKVQSNSMYHYIEDNHPEHDKLYTSIRDCGSYLVFDIYPSLNQARLRQTYTCKKHLLCRFCAITRAAKMVKRYKERFTWLMDTNPNLKAYMVTTTVLNGTDLKTTFDKLRKSTQYNHKKRHLKNRKCEAKKASAGVYSYEIKRGKNSEMWHPHSHAIWLCEEEPSAIELSEEWYEITGDSYIVDIREIDVNDPDSAFCEVLKYAIKFSDQPQDDTWHCYQTLRGKRLLGSFGDFYGVPEPDNLLDDPLEGVEFYSMMYRFSNGKYYTTGESF
jgi:hypothetical protein